MLSSSSWQQEDAATSSGTHWVVLASCTVPGRTFAPDTKSSCNISLQKVYHGVAKAKGVLKNGDTQDRFVALPDYGSRVLSALNGSVEHLAALGQHSQIQQRLPMQPLNSNRSASYQQRARSNSRTAGISQASSLSMRETAAAWSSGHPSMTRPNPGPAQLLPNNPSAIPAAHPPLPQHVCQAAQNAATSLTPAAAQALVRAASVPSMYTGIFDGHSGTSSAELAAARMQQVLALNPQLWQALGEEPSQQQQQQQQQQDDCAPGVYQAFRAAFSAVDGEIMELLKTTGSVDGTTALAGLQIGQQLIVANAGDSRAVLCRGSKAVRLSQDHKPNLPKEKSRIEALGGEVQFQRGCYRVMLPMPNSTVVKICAVSRALGDPEFKAPRLLISSEPDVSVTQLQPHVDRFTIFASDGLWGAVSDQEAVEAVCEELDAYAKMTTITPYDIATAAARKLVRLAQDRGSVDDITIIINLYDWGKRAAEEDKGKEGAAAAAEL